MQTLQKKGRGVRHTPTQETIETVEGMAAVGITQEQIAEYLGISVDTLYKYYKEQLRRAGIEANTSVAQSLYSQATSGNVTAQIFWLKTRAGWKEKADTNDDKDKGEPNNIVMQFASIPEKPTDHK